MRVIVVGGDLVDWDFFRDKLTKLLSKLTDPVLLIRGGKGRTDADRFAEKFCTLKNGVEKYVMFHQDAEQYGKDASGIRADEMVENGAGALIAFVDGEDEDAGVVEVIEAAEVAGLKIKVVKY